MVSRVGVIDLAAMVQGRCRGCQVRIS